MEKKRAVKIYKKICALLLTVAMVLTTGNIDNYKYIFAAELPEHVLLKDTKFDVKVNLNAEYDDLGNIDVVLHYGRGENAVSETKTMKVNKKVGTITGVPVYVKADTVSLAEGGDGTYETDPYFYELEIPSVNSDSMYNLSFGGYNRGDYESYLNISKDANDLIWTVTAKETIFAKERETKTYSFKTTFYSENEVSKLPAGYSVSLYYTEGYESHHVTASKKEYLGNSSFRFSFNKIPTTEMIDPTVRFYVPRISNYVAYVDGERKEYSSYVYSEGVAHNAVYIEKTNMLGTISWRDANDEYSCRPDVDSIKETIKVYQIVNEEDDLSGENDDILLNTDYDLELVDNGNDTWSISISNLPRFDLYGNALNYYYIVSEASEIAGVNGVHTYTRQYDNGSNSTNKKVAYSGATIYMVLADEDEEGGGAVVREPFYINISWRDDQWNNENNVARAEEITGDGVTLYLWRYTKNIENGAAVYDDNGDQYSFKIDATDINNDILKVSLSRFNSERFPTYNENGERYYYYVTVVDKNNNYYVKYQSGTKATYGDTVKLIRTGSRNIAANVIWKAIGEEDYIGTVTTLYLQRGYMSDTTYSWEDISTPIVTSRASKSASTVKGVFYSIARYDDDGQTYRFRILQSKQENELSGKTVDISKTSWEQNEEGTEATTEYEYCNHSYVSVASYDNDTYKIINRLTGKTNILMNDSWSCTSAPSTFRTVVADTLAAEKETATSLLKYQIRKDGALYATVIVADGKFYVEYEDGITEGRVTEGTITQSEASNTIKWAYSKIPVDKYNSEGAKFSYSFSEVLNEELANFKNNSVEGRSKMNCETDSSIAEKSITINYSHYFTVPGKTYAIYITKKWMDSITDIEKRSVKVHLVVFKKNADGKYTFYRDLGKEKEEGGHNLPNESSASYYSIEYSNANAFEGYLRYSPIDSEVATRNDYYYGAVEYSITYDGTTVLTPFALANFQQGDVVDNKYLFSGGETDTELNYLQDPVTGNVDIKVYPYTITNSNTTMCTWTNSNGSKVITNTIGSLKQDVKVDIEWRDSDNQSGYRKDALKLILYRNIGGENEEVVDTKIFTTPANPNGENYTYTFANVPYYDSNGSSYNYYVRQYIMDGVNDSLIDEVATEDTTENNYVMYSTDNTAVVLENGVCKIKKDIYIHNKATSKHHTVEFYIVWRDEEAYQHDKSRTDMNYTLYRYNEVTDSYDKCPDEDQHFVIKTASTAVEDNGTSNPYYQKAIFSELDEYNSEGDKYQYYVKESKTASAVTIYDYQIIHYDTDYTHLVLADGVTGKNYYHRKWDGSYSPSASGYTPANGVIFNTIYGAVNISGKKRWVNLSNKAVKPDATIYLYRRSNHDTDNDINNATPVSYWETKFNNDKTEYSFTTVRGSNTGSVKDFDKYDEYGALYKYSVDEKIFAEDGNEISTKIISGSAESNQLLINTFDPEQKNQRSIKIDKKWTGTTITSSESVILPAARFYLYRIESNYTVDNGAGRQVVPAVTALSETELKSHIDLTPYSGSFEKYLKESDESELVETIYLQYDSSRTDGATSKTIDDLSIYAPDGKPYAYFFIEDKDYAKSYKPADDNYVRFVPNTNPDISIENDSSDNLSTVSYINEYKDETFIKIKGTINWKEGTTELGIKARPSITEANDYIGLTVYKAAGKQENLDKTNADSKQLVDLSGATIEWTQVDVDGDGYADDKVWTYTITFPTGQSRYSENGNSYYYYVNESYKSYKNNTISKNYDIYNNGRYNTTDKCYEDPDAVHMTLNIPVITNQLGGTYDIQKSWIDGYDSYGLRPEKVLVMYQYKDGEDWKALRYSADAGATLAGKVVTKELSKANSWKSNITIFPMQVLDTTSYYKYRVVEIGIGYISNNVTNWVQTTSVDLSSYTTADGLTMADTTWNYDASGSYKYDYKDEYDTNGQLVSVYQSDLNFGSYIVCPGDENGIDFKSRASATTKVKNRLDKSTRVKITKNWDDDSNYFGLRPAVVTFTLQKKMYTIIDNPGGDPTKELYMDWTDVSDVALTAKDNTSASDPNVWEKTFSNLPTLDMEDHEIEYRIVEKSITSGEGDTAYKMASYNWDPSTQATTITNTLQSNRTVTIHKDWLIEGGNATAKTKGYKAVIEVIAEFEDETTKTATVTLDGTEATSYTKVYSKIPKYNADGSPLKSVSAKEVMVKGVGSTDSVVNYDDKNNKNETIGSFVATVGTENVDWQVNITKNSDETEFTITNKELTSHKLSVSYVGDTAVKDTYSTRPTTSKAKLQYRVSGSSTWSDIDTSSDFYKNLNSGAKISFDSADSADDSYYYEATLLPLREKIGGVINKYEYRIIETKQNTLSTAYDSESESNISDLAVKKVGSSGNYQNDRTAGGYSYDYQKVDDKNDSLEKTIYLVAVKGTKVWNDNSDKFYTRPASPGVGTTQSASSDIAVTVYKAQTAVSGITINWTQDANINKWNYETDAVLPKYKSVTNTLETYTVKETKSDSGYSANYGAEKNEASLNGNVAEGNTVSPTTIYYNVSDIQNSLEMKNLKVRKIWDTDEVCQKIGADQISVTYTLQSSTDGTTFADVLYNNGGSSDPLTITLTRASATTVSGKLVTDGTLTDLPTKTKDGNTYTYRIIETQVKIKLNNVDVTYDLTYDASNYTVKETIDTQSQTTAATFAKSDITGATSYSYTMGILKASYSVDKTGTNPIYQFTNKFISTSAKANVSWIEKKVGGASNDSELIKNYRPNSVPIVLQRTATGAGTDWEDVTASVTGNSTINLAIDKTHNSFELSAETAGTDVLPLYFVDGTAGSQTINTYEYRLIESKFVYENGNRVLNYDPDENGKTITSDFDTNNHECNDKTDGRTFYEGDQSNDYTSNVYTTTIVNSLCTDKLVDQVFMKLTGKVTWYDQSDLLGKRPGTTGIDMVIRGRTKGTTTVLESKDIKIGADAFTTFTFVGKTATISFVKNGDDTWSYSITGLPLYDANGNYIEYSICHKNNPTDYIGKASSNEAGQNTSDSEKYAYGTVIDTVNDYSESGKLIKQVDFQEEMVTEVNLTKTWVDQDNKYEARPLELRVELQSRPVAVSGSDITPAGDWSNIEEITIAPSEAEKNTNTWTYSKKNLPQYDDNGNAIQYRLVEIGTDKNGNEVLFEDISDEVKGNTFITNDTDHIQSYYMSVFDVAWDNGHSNVEITNNLDRRSDVTVKKEWKVNGDSHPSEVKVKLVGVVTKLQNQELVDTQAAEYTHVLDNSNNWEFTYTDLPKYDEDFSVIKWSVEELTMGPVGNQVTVTQTTLADSGEKAGLSSDNNWLVRYVKEQSADDGLNDVITFTVINEPTTSAKLSVTYINDFINKFSTRLDDTTAKLQFRVDSSDPWEFVSANGSDNSKAINAKILSDTGSLDQVKSQANSYVYEYDYLPKYLEVANVITPVEYRVVETKQGSDLSALLVSYIDETCDDSKDLALNSLNNVAVQYQDAANAGYTYTYDYVSVQSDARLKKELLKVTLTGDKKWDDVSDAFENRPLITDQGTVAGGKYLQTDAAEIKMVISEKGTVSLVQPDVYWKNHASDSNAWVYETSQLPKYRAQTNLPAEYQAKEVTDNQQYVARLSGPTEDATRTKLDVETITGTIGDISGKMYDLTNTFCANRIIVKKQWRNSNNNQPAFDVKFKLQKKIVGVDADFVDVDSSYMEKTISKSQNPDTAYIEWDGVPNATRDGKEIQYKVIETSTDENYVIDFDKEQDSDTITYTFYNIETQSFEVEKKWKDTISSIAPNPENKYKSEGVIQQKVGNGSWENANDFEAQTPLTWSFENTFDEINDPSVTISKQYTRLPKYDKTGKVIQYRGLEKKVNGYSLDGYEKYDVDYDYQTTKTTVTNSLKVVLFKIVKTDKTDGSKLSGVSFDLYKAKAQSNSYVRDEATPSFTGTTDANGEIVFNVLETGVYELVETAGLSGYKNDYDKFIEVKTSDYHTTKTVEVKNERKLGSLEMYKKDQNSNQFIDDITFTIYKVGGSGEGWEFKTGRKYSYGDAQGTITSGVTTVENIPWGSYYLVETDADGYVISTDKYYFTVNNITSENPIQLTYEAGGDVGGNVIFNTKNHLLFQKQSVTGTVLYGGDFEIHKVNSDGTKTKVSFYLSDTVAASEKVNHFTIEQGNSTVSIYGLAKGNYVFKEKTAPAGYRIADDLAFYVDAEGKIWKTKNGEVWTGNTVIMQDMPFCSMKVIKKFVDDTLWVNTIRPESIEVMLYQHYTNASGDDVKVAYGEAAKIEVNVNDDTYTKTFSDLPMYVMDNNTACATSYSVEELPLEDPIYDVTYSSITREDVVGTNQEDAGAQHVQTIYNTAATPTELFITKKNLNGPAAAEFNVETYIGVDDDHLHKYSDKYSLGTYDFDTDTFTADGTDRNIDDGFSTLKGDETVRIVVPSNVVYTVVEVLPESDYPEYEATYERLAGKNHVVITNSKIIYTAIDNLTENEKDGDEVKSYDAGGTIGVIQKASDGHDVVEDSFSEVEYKEGKFGVYWKADADWVSAPSFTVYYNEFSGDVRGEETKAIEVNNFLDENGDVKPAEDSCYDALRARYNGFEISQNKETGVIVLYLSDNIEGMPYLNDVKINFLPTIAAINTTKDQVGGSVKVESGSYQTNSDGKNENEDPRYIDKNKAYAKATKDYQVDLKNIEIANVDGVKTDKAYKLKLNKDKTFSITLQYTMAGVLSDYTLTGKINVLKEDKYKNPTEVEVVLDSLSIPVDVGLSFVKAKKPNDSDDKDDKDDNKNGGKPKTGDSNAIYGWMLLMIAGLGIFGGATAKRKTKRTNNSN